MPYELAALGSAFLWAVGSLIAADLSRDLGGVIFNRLRSTSVFFILLVTASLMGVWSSIRQDDLWLIFLSGFIGITLGDSAVFTAMKRLGPRLSHIFYACNAPITVVMSILFLGSSLSARAFLGITLVFSGVLVAIAWGKKHTHTHRWEQIEGVFWVGAFFGILGALGQATGAILIKPVMDHGANPIAVTGLRVGLAALMLNLHWFYAKRAQTLPEIKPRQVALSALNGFLSMGLGLSLLMYAFAKGDVGIASILSATTPVLVLPLLWLTTSERPAWGAWVGASLAVLGTAVLLAD